MTKDLPRHPPRPEAVAAVLSAARRMARPSAAERQAVAVVGSPTTSSEFTVDIMVGSITSPLEGKLVYFDVEEIDESPEDGRPLRIRKRVLCQVLGVRKYNPWHEDPGMKPIIQRKGALQYLSAEGDCKIAVLTALGVFLLDDDGYIIGRGRLNTAPSSGIPVYLADEQVISTIMTGERGVFYLGYIAGTAGTKAATPAPVLLRHFGPKAQHGRGDALMLGVFGQTGSGKSVLAAQIIAGYAANKQMGILIIDPVGQFSQDRFGHQGEFRLSLHRLLSLAGREVLVRRIQDVALESPQSFVELLRRQGFFRDIGFKKAEKQGEIADKFATYLGRRLGKDSSAGNIQDDDLFEDHTELGSKGDGPTSLGDLTIADLDNAVHDYLAPQADIVYRSGLRSDDVLRLYEESRGSIQKVWQNTVAHFARDRIPLSQIAHDFLVDRKVVTLDLSYFDDPPYFILREILTRLREVIHRRFRDQDLSNGLVVLDEAHLFAPQDAERESDVGQVLNYLISSVRMMRKVGVGWMFITNSLTDFNKEIYKQLRVRIFAQGLTSGAEREHIREMVGDDALAIYEDLPDPDQSGVFSFMIWGAILALGTRGAPLFITGFSGEDEVIRYNSHVFRPPRSTGG